jgi:putative ABC transport system permease protein
MGFVSTLMIALRALRTNVLRSALTMLGIVIGVGAVIAMLGVGKGAQTRVEEQIRSLGTNVLLVSPSSTMTAGARSGSGGVQTLTEDDAIAVGREIPEVQISAPAYRSWAQVIYGNQNWGSGMIGATPEFFEVREWGLEAGRMFEPAELASSGKVVILGQTIASRLFGADTPAEDMVGHTVRVRRVPMVVVGIAARKGQSAVGQDQDEIIFVPLNTARTRIFGLPQGTLRRINNIWIKVAEGEDMKAAEESVRALLRQRHRLQPGQEDDFILRNMSEVMKAQEEASRAMTMLLAAIGGVSLLVGGIGIMNIMLVSVTERTREIGLRMAVGARGRDILSQFLVEAVTLSSIGGLIGVVVGVFAAELVGSSAGWRIEIDTRAIAMAFGFAALVGVFFGYYPARKASRLQPIDALRYE